MGLGRAMRWDEGWTIEGGHLEGQFYDVAGGHDTWDPVHFTPSAWMGSETGFTYPARIEEVGTRDEVSVCCHLIRTSYTPWVKLRGITLDEGSKTYGDAILFLEKLIQDPEEKWVATLARVDVMGWKGHDYDLMLGDFFHLKGDVSDQDVAERGTFLNRELVEMGLARMSG